MRPLLVFTALLSLAGCSSWQPDAEDIEPVRASGCWPISSRWKTAARWW